MKVIGKQFVVDRRIATRQTDNKHERTLGAWLDVQRSDYRAGKLDPG